MSYIPSGAGLRLLNMQNSTTLYQLQAEGLANQYYVVSGEGTRHLMASPEVVGYESYLAMKPATTAALDYFHRCGLADEVNILTILRGGLNYPLEECCYKAGIRVPNMNFISCERRIEDDVITGLDIKYEKLHIAKDITLMIGDIIASGDTLRLCLSQVVDYLSSVELAAMRYDEGAESSTYRKFYGLRGDLKRNYLKQVRRKLI